MARQSENPYKNVAILYCKQMGYEFKRWEKMYSLSSAIWRIESAEGAKTYKDADSIATGPALWMWYQAAKVAKGRLTINISEIGGDVMAWKSAAKYVRNLQCYPDVYATSEPYQLVLT